MNDDSPGITVIQSRKGFPAPLEIRYFDTWEALTRFMFDVHRAVESLRPDVFTVLGHLDEWEPERWKKYLIGGTAYRPAPALLKWLYHQGVTAPVDLVNLPQFAKWTLIEGAS